MSIKHTLYISPEENDDGGFDLHLLEEDLIRESVNAFYTANRDGRNRVGGEMRYKISDQSRLEATDLNEVMKGLETLLDGSVPGDYFSVAIDINGMYYHADDKAPLFTNWLELSQEYKSQIAKRLLEQVDPYRQVLLDTITGLPADQILSLFDFGMSQDNHLLMALAVQAMPETMLADKELTHHLSSDLVEVFKGFERSMPTECTEPAFSYPYFYALEKLKSGKIDCHVSAIQRDLDYYYFDSTINETEDESDTFDNKHLLNDSRTSKVYNNNGMVLAMATILVRGHKYDEALIYLNAPKIDYQNYVGRSHDSLMSGYADYERRKGQDNLDITLDLLGEETVANVLVSNLTGPKSQSFPLLTETQIALFNRIDSSIVMTRLHKAIMESDNLEDTKLMPFIKNLVLISTDQFNIRPDILKMHVNLYPRIGHCDVQMHLTRKVIDDDIIYIYSSREAIDAAMAYAINIISQYDTVYPQDAYSCLNQVFGYSIEASRVRGQYKSSVEASQIDRYGPARTAVLFLALSGMRYPDVLTKLDTISANHFIEVMDRLGVPYDPVEMALLLPSAKAKVLESSMNI